MTDNASFQSTMAPTSGWRCICTMLLIASMASVIFAGPISAQQPGLITSLGIVHVVENPGGYSVMLDDRTLRRVERSMASYPRIIDHVNDVGPYVAVILVQQLRYDSVCDGRSLFLVALASDGSSAVTNEVPYCAENEPAIKRVGNRVMVTLSTAVRGSRMRQQKRVWSFEKGRLVPSARKR